MSFAYSLTDTRGLAPTTRIIGNKQLEKPTFQYSRTFDVVLADDSEDALHLVQLALRNEYLHFRSYPNGELAIEACKQKLPDLAILDILMPGTNGIEVCRWIKENCGKTFTPVMLLTCQSELEHKVDGLNCGADEYVTKPFSVPELEARVRALLRIKDLTDKLMDTQNLLAQKEKQIVAMQVAGAAAHELGQPLTAMLLHCQLLSKLDQKHGDFGKTLISIQDHCKRMKDILDQLNSLEDYKTTEYAGNLEIVDISPKVSEEEQPAEDEQLIP